MIFCFDAEASADAVEFGLVVVAAKDGAVGPVSGWVGAFGVGQDVGGDIGEVQRPSGGLVLGRIHGCPFFICLLKGEGPNEAKETERFPDFAEGSRVVGSWTRELLAVLRLFGISAPNQRF